MPDEGDSSAPPSARTSGSSRPASAGESHCRSDTPLAAAAAASAARRGCCAAVGATTSLPSLVRGPAAVRVGWGEGRVRGEGGSVRGGACRECGMPFSSQ